MKPHLEDRTGNMRLDHAFWEHRGEQLTLAPRITLPDRHCECGETVNYINWRRHKGHEMAN